MQPNLVTEQIREVAWRRAEHAKAITTELEARATQTYLAAMRERARQYPAQTAVVYRGRALSYAQLMRAVDAVRADLHARGVQAGQVVALLMNNSDHYVVWYLAVMGLGAVAVPLNNRLVAHELKFILEHSRSSLLISEGAFEAVLAHPDVLALQLPVVFCDMEAEVACPSNVAFDQEPLLNANTPAAVYYTSGTTGQPKGVVHTHATLLADALQSPSAWEYDHADARLLAVTPLFHIAAHTCFFPVLFIGGALYIDNYGTERTIELVRRERITAMFAVPSILLLMVDKARAMGVTLDSVQTLYFGAAPMTIARLGDVQAMCPNAALVHGMGQTESGGTLVTLPGVVAMARAGSVGLPMAGVEVAIFDANDRPLPAGQVGELVARGPNVMQGYLHDAAASGVTLRGGWLHTGDLGFQSEEGLVTLVDRKKDMIIRGGENIYSSEVEQALLRHPKVKVAAVVGQPDPLFGEQVCAFIAADPESCSPTVDELLQHCKGLLADYKIPVNFQFVQEMPLTPTGKIMKAELRALLVNKEQAHV